MSLLLSRLSKLRAGKPALVRYSLLLSNNFSSSLLQTPPCYIVGAHPCGADLGKLVIKNANEEQCLEKKVPLELFRNDSTTIGSSNGWVATLKDDGILRLQDDLNPSASDSNPKRIVLPPLVTLPHCQTKIVTNVSMSSSSPEDEDCVVAVKFLGPQISFCKPAQSEWINVKIQNPCFHSSRVMFSKKHDRFRLPASGGHLIASYDLLLTKKQFKPKFQRIRFKNLPEMTETEEELMDSCCVSEHLVESRSTDETFLVKWYKQTDDSSEKFKTEALMVYKLEEEGNAVYTQDIGDLVIFLSDSEPFCVPASSFPGMLPNSVEFYDADGYAFCRLADSTIIAGGNLKWGGSEGPTPYHIPPQNIN